jgi:hypothetical protein
MDKTFTFLKLIEKDTISGLLNKTVFNKICNYFMSDCHKYHICIFLQFYSFSNGSILVKFVVYFTTKISPDDAYAPLENAIKDNKLGNFKIVPGSLGCSKPSE